MHTRGNAIIENLGCGVLKTRINREHILLKDWPKKITFFDSIFSNFHMGRRKEPKSDFQSLFF